MAAKPAFVEESNLTSTRIALCWRAFRQVRANQTGFQKPLNFANSSSSRGTSFPSVWSQMSVLIERLLRIAKSGGLSAAVLAVPMVGFANTGIETHTPARFQVAQATPRSAPERQTKPAQPAPPAAGNQEVERQITDLRRRLNITPAQQAQFDALAQAMRQNADAVSTLAQQAQQNGKPNAVEAVRAAGRFAEAEAEGLKRLLSPLQ